MEEGKNEKHDEPNMPRLPEKAARITASAEGADSMTLELELHIPTVIKALEEVSDGATVKIEVAALAPKAGSQELKPGERPELEVQWRTAFEGKRQDAIDQLRKSVIQAQAIPGEIYKFVRYVMDHSDLQAVSVCIACKDPDGKPAVAGFVHTAKHCTNEDAAVLVNCMDANTQEFITKAGLTIPGRSAPKADGIIIPTADDKEKLGL